MVILEPFWRMDTGNLLLGRLVSHTRKSLCTCLAVVVVCSGKREASPCAICIPRGDHRLAS